MKFVSSDGAKRLGGGRVSGQPWFIQIRDILLLKFNPLHSIGTTIATFSILVNWKIPACIFADEDGSSMTTRQRDSQVFLILSFRRKFFISSQLTSHESVGPN